MRRHKFAILVTSALLVLLAIGLFALRRSGVPQDYTLNVVGETGRKVAGTITADGVTHSFRGALPIEVEYRASRLEFAFAPADGKPDDSFGIYVLVNGNAWGRCISPDGVKGSLERTGIPGWGSRGGGIGGLNKGEIAALTR